MSPLPSCARVLACLLLAASAASLGCGSVVIETSTGASGGGGGGASSTGTATSTGTTSTGTATSTGTTGTGTSTGTSMDCGPLGQAYMMALAAASQCDACKNIDGCLNGPVYPDVCGCPTGTDATQPEAVKKAEYAYGAWIAAGCTPYLCGEPCAAGTSFHCLVAAADCTGFCAPQ